MSLEEPPDRCAAAGDASLTHRGHDLVQRQIRLPSAGPAAIPHAPPKATCSRRSAPLWRFQYRASAATISPPNSGSAGSSRAPPAGMDSTALIKRSRRSSEYGFGIDQAPQTESVPPDSLTHRDLGIPPIQTRRNLLQRPVKVLAHLVKGHQCRPPCRVAVVVVIRPHS